MFVLKLYITTGSWEMAETKCEQWGGELTLSTETGTSGEPQMERQTQDTLLLSMHTLLDVSREEREEGGGRQGHSSSLCTLVPSSEPFSHSLSFGFSCKPTLHLRTHLKCRECCSTSVVPGFLQWAWEWIQESPEAWGPASLQTQQQLWEIPLQIRCKEVRKDWQPRLFSDFCCVIRLTPATGLYEGFTTKECKSLNRPHLFKIKSQRSLSFQVRTCLKGGLCQRVTSICLCSHGASSVPAVHHGKTPFVLHSQACNNLLYLMNRHTKLSLRVCSNRSMFHTWTAGYHYVYISIPSMWAH